jgi:hypothetical protein
MGYSYGVVFEMNQSKFTLQVVDKNANIVIVRIPKQIRLPK